MKPDAKSTIEAGKAILGIEFGSTRIKAVLIDQENKPIAQGSHTWENQLVDGLWTYSVEAIWYGQLRIISQKRISSKIAALHALQQEILSIQRCQLTQHQDWGDIICQNLPAHWNVCVIFFILLRLFICRYYHELTSLLSPL